MSEEDSKQTAPFHEQHQQPLPLPDSHNMTEEDNKQNVLSHEEHQQPFPFPGENKTWPELVGLPSEEAKRRIEEEIPGINVQIVPPDSIVTMDFSTGRVRIFTDSSGKVYRAPMIG